MKALGTQAKVAPTRAMFATWTVAGALAAGLGLGCAATPSVPAQAPPVEGPEDSPTLEIQEAETSPQSQAPRAAETPEDPSRGAADSGNETGSEDDRTAPELFLQANQAYEQGSYPQAIDLYRTLVDRGYEDGRLLYNLGNAYLRDGQLGQAVASYRRSLARRPRDQDVQANLEFARRSTRDALAPPTPSPWISTLFFWHFRMSRSELAWTVLILNLVLWTLLALGRLRRRRTELLPWLLGGVLLCLVGSGGSLLVHELWPQRVAVVLPPEIDARSGPGADAVVRYKLHAGTEVAVEDITQGWVRIEGPERQQAWVEDDQVAVIRW